MATVLVTHSLLDKRQLSRGRGVQMQLSSSGPTSNMLGKTACLWSHHTLQEVQGAITISHSV